MTDSLLLAMGGRLDAPGRASQARRRVDAQLTTRLIGDLPNSDPGQQNRPCAGGDASAAAGFLTRARARSAARHRLVEDPAWRGSIGVDLALTFVTM
jgi:hypothetical protein